MGLIPYLLITISSLCTRKKKIVAYFTLVWKFLYVKNFYHI